MNIRRFLAIFLLHEGIMLTPFLLLTGYFYMESNPITFKSFFNSWTFAIAIIILGYLQVCTLGLTILRYFNCSRRWIFLWSLLLIILLLLNQVSFYYLSLADLYQRLIEGLAYAGILLAIQMSFQLISEFLCKRLKLISI